MSRAVLVIGGGIAGIQASIDLANLGFRVHLVERTPSIGGRMAQLDKTFPTNDCSITKPGGHRPPKSRPGDHRAQSTRDLRPHRGRANRDKPRDPSKIGARG